MYFRLDNGLYIRFNSGDDGPATVNQYITEKKNAMKKNISIGVSSVNVNSGEL